MSFPFSTLDLLSKYIRHDVPIYCHDHPTQPDGMNACVKDIETRLKAFELPDTAAEMSNPVDLGTLKLRDNAGVFEISADDGATWEAVGTGSGGVTDHTLLTNIGVNSHIQVDGALTTLAAHVANTELHAGTTDHTALTNIGVNSHIQVDGALATLAAHVDNNSHLMRYAQDTIPDITTNSQAIWHDTYSGQFWLIVDFGGVQKKIELLT